MKSGRTGSRGNGRRRVPSPQKREQMRRRMSAPTTPPPPPPQQQQLQQRPQQRQQQQQQATATPTSTAATMPTSSPAPPPPQLVVPDKINPWQASSQAFMRRLHRTPVVAANTTREDVVTCDVSGTTLTAQSMTVEHLCKSMQVRITVDKQNSIAHIHSLEKFEDEAAEATRLAEAQRRLEDLVSIARNRKGTHAAGGRRRRTMASLSALPSGLATMAAAAPEDGPRRDAIIDQRQESLRASLLAAEAPNLLSDIRNCVLEGVFTLPIDVDDGVFLVHYAARHARSLDILRAVAKRTGSMRSALRLRTRGGVGQTVLQYAALNPAWMRDMESWRWILSQAEPSPQELCVMLERNASVSDAAVEVYLENMDRETGHSDRVMLAAVRNEIINVHILDILKRRRYGTAPSERRKVLRVFAEENRREPLHSDVWNWLLPLYEDTIEAERGRLLAALLRRGEHDMAYAALQRCPAASIWLDHDKDRERLDSLLRSHSENDAGGTTPPASPRAGARGCGGAGQIPEWCQSIPMLSVPVHICGPVGVGKTRLVQELSAAATTIGRKNMSLAEQIAATEAESLGASVQFLSLGDDDAKVQLISHGSAFRALSSSIFRARRGVYVLVLPLETHHHDRDEDGNERENDDSDDETEGVEDETGVVEEWELIAHRQLSSFLTQIDSCARGDRSEIIVACSTPLHKGTNDRRVEVVQSMLHRLIEVRASSFATAKGASTAAASCARVHAAVLTLPTGLPGNAFLVRSVLLPVVQRLCRAFSVPRICQHLLTLLREVLCEREGLLVSTVQEIHHRLAPYLAERNAHLRPEHVAALIKFLDTCGEVISMDAGDRSLENKEFVGSGMTSALGITDAAAAAVAAAAAAATRVADKLGADDDDTDSDDTSSSDEDDNDTIDGASSRAWPQQQNTMHTRAVRGAAATGAARRATFIGVLTLGNGWDDTRTRVVINPQAYFGSIMTDLFKHQYAWRPHSVIDVGQNGASHSVSVRMLNDWAENIPTPFGTRRWKLAEALFDGDLTNLPVHLAHMRWCCRVQEGYSDRARQASPTKRLLADPDQLDWLPMFGECSAQTVPQHAVDMALGLYQYPRLTDRDVEDTMWCRVGRRIYCTRGSCGVVEHEFVRMQCILVEEARRNRETQAFYARLWKDAVVIGLSGDPLDRRDGVSLVLVRHVSLPSSIEDGFSTGAVDVYITGPLHDEDEDDWEDGGEPHRLRAQIDALVEMLKNSLPHVLQVRVVALEARDRFLDRQGPHPGLVRRKAVHGAILLRDRAEDDYEDDSGSDSGSDSDSHDDDGAAEDNEDVLEELADKNAIDEATTNALPNTVRLMHHKDGGAAVELRGPHLLDAYDYLHRAITNVGLIARLLIDHVLPLERRFDTNFPEPPSTDTRAALVHLHEQAVAYTRYLSDDKKTNVLRALTKKLIDLQERTWHNHRVEEDTELQAEDVHARFKQALGFADLVLTSQLPVQLQAIVRAKKGELLFWHAQYSQYADAHNAGTSVEHPPRGLWLHDSHGDATWIDHPCERNTRDYLRVLWQLVRRILTSICVAVLGVQPPREWTLVDLIENIRTTHSSAYLAKLRHNQGTSIDEAPVAHCLVELARLRQLWNQMDHHHARDCVKLQYALFPLTHALCHLSGMAWAQHNGATWQRVFLAHMAIAQERFVARLWLFGSLALLHDHFDRLPWRQAEMRQLAEAAGAANWFHRIRVESIGARQRALAAALAEKDKAADEDAASITTTCSASSANTEETVNASAEARQPDHHSEVGNEVSGGGAGNIGSGAETGESQPPPQSPTATPVKDTKASDPKVPNEPGDGANKPGDGGIEEAPSSPLAVHWGDQQERENREEEGLWESIVQFFTGGGGGEAEEGKQEMAGVRTPTEEDRTWAEDVGTVKKAKGEDSSSPVEPEQQVPGGASPVNSMNSGDSTDREGSVAGEDDNDGDGDGDGDGEDVKGDKVDKDLHVAGAHPNGGSDDKDDGQANADTIAGTAASPSSATGQEAEPILPASTAGPVEQLLPTSLHTLHDVAWAVSAFSQADEADRVAAELEQCSVHLLFSKKDGRSLLFAAICQQGHDEPILFAELMKHCRISGDCTHLYLIRWLQTFTNTPMPLLRDAVVGDPATALCSQALPIEHFPKDDSHHAKPLTTCALLQPFRDQFREQQTQQNARQNRGTGGRRSTISPQLHRSAPRLKQQPRPPHTG